MTAVFLMSFMLPRFSEMPENVVLTFQVPSLRVCLFKDLEEIVVGTLIKTIFSAFGLLAFGTTTRSKLEWQGNSLH